MKIEDAIMLTKELTEPPCEIDTENNETIEGALMVYIYTKPQAQEMWEQGVKTTEWVEAVKELMK